MKTLLTTLLILLLTSCVTYHDRITGEWVTESWFGYEDTVHTKAVRLTVHVVSTADLDKICQTWGIVRACEINGIVYIPGKRQTVTMILSPEYINSLPTCTGKAGDMLAEKLGLELGFNQRESLGHEALLHIFSVTTHMGKGTPHI